MGITTRAMSLLQCYQGDVGIIIRAMSALSPERCRHHYQDDVVIKLWSIRDLWVVRVQPLERCRYYNVISTIRAMSALSSERCHHYHQGDVRHISPRLSAFLLAFLFVLPIVWLGILQIKVPDTTSLPFPFTNYLYFTLSFPFADSLSSTNRSIF